MKTEDLTPITIPKQRLAEYLPRYKESLLQAIHFFNVRPGAIGTLAPSFWYPPGRRPKHEEIAFYARDLKLMEDGSVTATMVDSLSPRASIIKTLMEADLGEFTLRLLCQPQPDGTAAPFAIVSIDYIIKPRPLDLVTSSLSLGQD